MNFAKFLRTSFLKNTSGPLLLYVVSTHSSTALSQEKTSQDISSKGQKRQRLIIFILVKAIQYPRILKSNIYYSSKRVPLPFFHSDTNPVFSLVLIHSFDKTHVLVVTVELIWLLLLNIISFNFIPMLNKFLLGWQDSEEAM